MKKLIKIIVSVIACVTACFCTACKVPASQSVVSDKVMTAYIDKMIADTPSYIPAWNKEEFKGRWNYIDGVFLNSVVQLYNDTKNKKYKDFFLTYLNYYISEDGNFNKYEFIEDGKYKCVETGNKGFDANALDTVCESRVLFDAFDLTKDSRYFTAIEYTYSCLINMTKAAGTDNFVHKEGYKNQVWLDGMYMYAPFLARYAKMAEDSNLFDLIAKQYKFVYENMRDSQTGLYYHGIYTGTDPADEAYWAKDKNTSPSFWLRSEGWLLTSLVDIIEYFPKGENKTYLTDMLKEGVSAVYKYRDGKTGMFYQLIDKGEFKTTVPANYFNVTGNIVYGGQDAEVSNYVESSGSSMLAYVMMKGARLKYLDSDYLKKGKGVFEAIYKHSFSPETNELRDICISAGLGDANSAGFKTDKFYLRDGSAEYYLAECVGSNDAKGVGPFIMAYLQY